METKQKAFIYTRRSQDRDDRQVLSIDGQKQELTKLIQTHEYNPIWLPAEERTAHKTGRPIFDDMVRRIEAGESRIVVVWSANRLARNALDGGRLIHYLHTGQLLKIVTPGRQYSSASMEDQFMLQIEFGMSKMYSDEISKNVKRGYRSKYERGEYPTQAPLGYVNKSVQHAKNIYPDPEKAALVVRCFEQVSTGTYTLKEIWQYARDELGLTTRKGHPVARQTIFDMLHNIVYTGTFKHGGEYHKGSYTPLISKELYDQVQFAMGWRRGPGAGRGSTAGRDYPFKGPFVCPQCGHNVTAYTKSKKLKTTGDKVEYVYYGCTKKNKSIKCLEPQISEHELGIQIIEQLRKVKLTQNECSLALDYVRQFHEEYVNSKNKMLKSWKKDADEARVSLDRLLSLRMDNEIDSETFRDRKQKYEAALARTKQLIDGGDSNASKWLELAEEFFTGASTIVDTFEKAPDDQKRRMLIEVGSNWQLQQKKALFTPRKPYDLLVNRTENTNWRARPDSNRRSSP